MAKTATEAKKAAKAAEPLHAVKETKRGFEITTAKMRTGFTQLHEPSFKFKEETGEYSVQLIGKADSPEVQELVAILDKAMAESEEAAKVATKKKKVKIADPPYKEEEDEEGLPTGNIKFNIKMAAKYIKKEKDAVTGKERVVKVTKNTPVLYTAKGKPIPSGLQVGGGSTVKVNFLASPFYTDGFGAGVSLKLKAVQVIDLKQYEVTFEGAGFKEEDGYDPEDIEVVTVDPGVDRANEDASDGDDDAESDF
jgi:hypothetical protein